MIKQRSNKVLRKAIYLSKFLSEFAFDILGETNQCRSQTLELIETSVDNRLLLDDLHLNIDNFYLYNSITSSSYQIK